MEVAAMASKMEEVCLVFAGSSVRSGRPGCAATSNRSTQVRFGRSVWTERKRAMLRYAWVIFRTAFGCACSGISLQVIPSSAVGCRMTR